MTTYEYWCPKCDDVIELQFRFGYQPKAISCEKCNGPRERYFGSGATFILKGDWPGKAISQDNEVMRNQEKANSRMRHTWKAPKLVDQR